MAVLSLRRPCPSPQIVIPGCRFSRKPRSEGLRLTRQQQSHWLLRSQSLTTLPRSHAGAENQLPLARAILKDPSTSTSDSSFGGVSSDASWPRTDGLHRRLLGVNVASFHWWAGAWFASVPCVGPGWPAGTLTFIQSFADKRRAVASPQFIQATASQWPRPATK